MEEQKENWTHEIPVNGMGAVMFFNSKELMEQSITANPDFVPVFGSDEIAGHFPGVFAVLRKEPMIDWEKAKNEILANRP